MSPLSRHRRRCRRLSSDASRSRDRRTTRQPANCRSCANSHEAPRRLNCQEAIVAHVFQRSLPVSSKYLLPCRCGQQVVDRAASGGRDGRLSVRGVAADPDDARNGRPGAGARGAESAARPGPLGGGGTDWCCSGGRALAGGDRLGRLALLESARCLPIDVIDPEMIRQSATDLLPVGHLGQSGRR